MANTREELVNRFIAFNGAGKVQTAVGTALANADLDTRDKCTITREEIITRRETRDCRNEDLTGTQIQTRMARYTLVYAEVTPQILHRHAAWFLGSAQAPTGAQANEVQTLTRNGTVSGGTFTIALTLEGRTVTTKPIAYDATTAVIQAALTAARMLFIQPGDVVVTGDWGAGIVLTFPETGRLGRANLPIVVTDSTLITGGGTVDAAETTPGNNYYHVAERSADRDKLRITFALGYEDNTATIEKYADYVVESFQPSANLDTDPSLTVTLLGPWDYDSLEPTLTVPECVNPTPLQTADVKVKINGNWESTDVNTLAVNLNDNIPVDRLSAFPYDGIDVQNLVRGRQPTYLITQSIFGMSAAAVHTLARNERTQTPVEEIIHFGQPGNRFTLIFPQTEIRFQTNPEAFVGAAEFSAIQLEGLPVKDGANPPVSAEGYLDQATTFLDT